MLVDNAKANESINKTGKEADSLASKLGRGFSSAGKAITSGAALVGSGLVAVGGAMLGVTAKALETTSTISKFSQTMNVSTDDFQKYDAIAKTFGFTAEDMAGDFAGLSEKMLANRDAGAEAEDGFTKLGVSVTNADGTLKNTGQMFDETIMSLQNMTDRTEAQAIASDLLGTTSEELAPLLAMTNEEFMAMKDNAKVIDEDQINKAAQLKESWDKVKQTFSNVVTELGVNLMPVFGILLDWINQNMPQIQDACSKAFEVVSNVVGKAVDTIQWLIDAFGKLFESSEGTGDGISQVWDAVKEMFDHVFTKILELVQSFSGLFQSIWDEWGSTITIYIEGVWNVIKIVFETVFNVINDLLKIFTALFKGDWEGLWQGIKDLVTNIWEGIKALIENYFNTIAGILSSIGSKISKAWDDMWTSVGDFCSNAWENIKTSISNGVKSALDKTIEMATSVIAALESLPADAMQMAKDFVSGFIAGITNSISRAVGAVQDFSGQCVDAAKDFLGIHSPSRVMMEVGAFTAEGMAVGIEENTDLVTKAVNKMTSFKDDDIDIDMTNSEKGTGQQQIVINVYNPVVRNKEETKNLSRELQKDLAIANRARGE